MLSHGNIAVFGANGFVGKNLKLGDEACLFDNFSLNNPPSDNVNFHDITKIDRGMLAGIFKEHSIATVINLAAIHHIPYCNSHPEEATFVNAYGNLMLYEFCRNQNVKSYIFASSGAVYRPSQNPHRETDELESSDIYSSTKLISEMQMRGAACNNPMTVTALRLFNIVGAHDYTPHLLPDLFYQCSQAGNYVDVGNLDTIRDYIHVSDVVELIKIVAAKTLPYKFKAVNVCTGQGHSGHKVLNAMQKAMNTSKKVRVVSEKLRRSDRPSQVGVNEAAKEIFDWIPKYTLEDGVADYVNWRLS